MTSKVVLTALYDPSADKVIRLVVKGLNEIKVYQPSFGVPGSLKGRVSQQIVHRSFIFRSVIEFPHLRLGGFW